MALVVLVLLASRDAVEFSILEWFAIVGLQLFIWLGRVVWGGRVIRRLDRLDDGAPLNGGTTK